MPQTLPPALPQTLLEAMAVGVPVIANEGSGSKNVLRDIIVEGQNGYLVPGNDRAIFARQTRKILSDTKHAEQLSAAAAKTMGERFSLDAMTHAYAELYERSRVT